MACAAGLGAITGILSKEYYQHAINALDQVAGMRGYIQYELQPQLLVSPLKNLYDAPLLDPLYSPL